MAVTFKIPDSPKKQVYETDQFLGADFTSEASNINPYMSPNCENMIRSVPGKIRKRMGYFEFANFGATIYGIHYFSITDTWLVHAGNALYNLTSLMEAYWWTGARNVDPPYNYSCIATGNWASDAPFISLRGGQVADARISTGLAEHKSVSFELNHKLIILDGSKVWQFYKPSANADPGLYEIAGGSYIPTLTIDKDPDGGGTDYEPLNLINSRFKEKFYVDSRHNTTKKFQMSFGDLNSSMITAKVLQDDGTWDYKWEDDDFTVNRTTGTITFSVAPGQSPVEGESNVEIEVGKDFSGYKERIYHCTIGTMYGVNGAHDRIFLSGNPDSGFNSEGTPYTYINCDWFCGQYDPTYWPDTNYSKLGADNSAIMGYSIINNYLATHKDTKDATQSIIIRTGEFIDDQPAFKIVNTLQGAGAISKYCFSYLATEPAFLTPYGIYAVTTQDVTGEKYTQDRSYYLEGKLLKEKNLKNAHSFAWKDYYVLAVNGNLYILDGLQPLRTDKAMPYSTRLYAGFYFTNIPANCFADINDALFFGGTDGKLYCFFADPTEIRAYNDNGAAIRCIWETADIDKQLFYKKKTYRYLALRCLPEIQSSVQILAQKEGQWTELKDDQTKLKYFSYANMTYSKMTYSTDATQRISSAKIRLKKLDHTRFKFVNGVLNEPLSINNFAVEYTQAGNVK